MLKILKLSFNNTETTNFQMYRVDLEKAREQRLKITTSVGSKKKQENSRKHIYFCFTDYAKGFDYVDHNKLWKNLKDMGIPDHPTCLLRNLYVGQEATVRTKHGTDWFKIGKGVHQAVYCHPAYLTSMQSTS